MFPLRVALRHVFPATNKKRSCFSPCFIRYTETHHHVIHNLIKIFVRFFSGCSSRGFLRCCNSYSILLSVGRRHLRHGFAVGFKRYMMNSMDIRCEEALKKKKRDALACGAAPRHPFSHTGDSFRLGFKIHFGPSGSQRDRRNTSPAYPVCLVDHLFFDC